MTRTATPRQARPAAPACCPPTPATSSHGGNVFGVVSATYTDHGVGHDNVQTLSTTSQSQIRQKHQEVEFVVNQSGTNTATNTDGGRSAGRPGMHRGSLAAGRLDPAQRAVQPAEHQLVTFRVADAAAGRTAGSPLAAIEVHQDTLTGPIVQTYNLVSTGGTAVWTSQTFPISLVGHARAVPRVPCGDRRPDRQQPVQPQLGRVPAAPESESLRSPARSRARRRGGAAVAAPPSSVLPPDAKVLERRVGRRPSRPGPSASRP